MRKNEKKKKKKKKERKGNDDEEEKNDDIDGNYDAAATAAVTAAAVAGGGGGGVEYDLSDRSPYFQGVREEQGRQLRGPWRGDGCAEERHPGPQPLQRHTGRGEDRLRLPPERGLGVLRRQERLLLPAVRDAPARSPVPRGSTELPPLQPPEQVAGLPHLRGRAPSPRLARERYLGGRVGVWRGRGHQRVRAWGDAGAAEVRVRQRVPHDAGLVQRIHLRSHPWHRPRGCYLSCGRRPSLGEAGPHLGHSVWREGRA